MNKIQQLEKQIAELQKELDLLVKANAIEAIKKKTKDCLTCHDLIGILQNIPPDARIVEFDDDGDWCCIEAIEDIYYAYSKDYNLLVLNSHGHTVLNDIPIENVIHS